MLKLVAKALMKAWPSYPSGERLDLAEVFQRSDYLNASPDRRNEIQLESAAFRYEYEKENGFFDRYFDHIEPGSFEGKRVLDLGCFTGGRVVYWFEQLKFCDAHGIDVNPLFEDAAKRFAEHRGVPVSFKTGWGENLPYEDDFFDCVVTYDVLEHVRDVGQVMDEIYRVLKPGGRLLAVFPPFFQPLESHLNLITGMPALHWLFSGKTLTRAYWEIGQERGQAAAWYRRNDPKLADWERLPTLNGITARKFRNIICKQSWKLLSWSHRPILSSGRKSRWLIFRVLRLLFFLPARLPVLEELFLDRIAVVLEKPALRQGVPVP